MGEVALLQAGVRHIGANVRGNFQTLLIMGCQRISSGLHAITHAHRMAKIIGGRLAHKGHLDVAPVLGPQYNARAVRLGVNGLYARQVTNGIDGFHRLTTGGCGIFCRSRDFQGSEAIDFKAALEFAGGDGHRQPCHLVFIHHGFDAGFL